jgi:Protein of unknown function (DUF3011)
VKKLWPATLALLIASLCGPAISWAQQITCESRNYQQEFCSTGPIANAWLLVQRSGSPCIQGQTWGFQGNGIWVNQGCSGDFGFQSTGGPPPAMAPGRPGVNRVSCESQNYQQQVCPTGQVITNAYVIEQRSGAPCIQGQSWGFRNSEIWVTAGCAADFGIQGYSGQAPVMQPVGTLLCESRNYAQQYCSTGQFVYRAWLVTQRSRSPCRQGQTWGYDRNGIWVTQGCEGEFGYE